MPTNKDFKRLIRARMEKTGEAYTAARANLLTRPTTRVRTNAPTMAAPALATLTTAALEPAPIDYAKIAGISDAALTKQTGCTWEKWVWALDRAGADAWSHRAIAEYVHDAYKVKPWWTQMVTVGYERIKGLREIGQGRNGGFEATKSKTIAASAAAVFRAFAEARTRRQWLPGVKVVVRRSTPSRSVRMAWPDGTLVEVWLTSKGARKTAAQVQHRKLVSKEDADQRRTFWEGRLTALRTTMETRA